MRDQERWIDPSHSAGTTRVFSDRLAIHVNPDSIKLDCTGLPTCLVGSQGQNMSTLPSMVQRKKAKPEKLRPDWALRLAEARISLGLSQAALGERVEKTQSNIGAYETGNSEPNLAAIKRLADTLGVSPAWIAFGIGTAGGSAPSERDAEAMAFLTGNKNDRLFVATFIGVWKMLTEEGLNPDLTSLILFARKVLEKAKSTAHSTEPADLLIARIIAEERAELRQGLEEAFQRRI